MTDENITEEINTNVTDELDKYGTCYGDRTFKDKKMRRIMIALKPAFYDEKTIDLDINLKTFERNNTINFVLTKIGQLNGFNLYDTECETILTDSAISFRVKNKIKSPYYFDTERCIFAEDDAFYNHVKDMCGTSLLSPRDSQESYSVCISIDMSITIFVTRTPSDHSMASPLK